MLSHACASCGKVLDGSSRTYSRDLRMWVARCGRCGFAVRWAPRVAREPARVWARLRALNLRLGIAVGTLQLAVLVLLFAGAYADSQLRRGLGARDLDSLLSNFAPSLVGAVVAGVFVGICAATLAPFRGIARSYLLAWLLAAIPVIAISALLVFGDAGPGQLWREFRSLASRHIEKPEVAALVVGTALVASAFSAVAIVFAVRTGIAQAVRRANRKRRETLALVRTPAPRPIGASA